MKRKLLFLVVAMLALSLATVVFASSTQQMVPFDQITAVQTDTALMVPETPDIGVAIVNAVTVNENSVVFEAVLKKDQTAHDSMSMEFSQVDAVSPPVVKFATSHSDQLMRKYSADIDEMITPALTQVKTLKNPTMMVAGIGHSPQSANIENTGIQSNKMVGAPVAVLPNTVVIKFGETAFSRSLIGSNVISATKMENNEVAIVVIGKIEVGKMVKESISSSCGTAYGTIIST